MTTAQRPTWSFAMGGSEQGGNRMIVASRQFSARDMPSHLKMKYRIPGQGTIDELKDIDFKETLMQKEKEHFEQTKPKITIKIPENEVTVDIKEHPEDADEKFSGSEDENAEALDEDQELMREFEKVKKEREEEAKNKAIQKSMEEESKQKEEILLGNPLLNSSSYSLKRRWTEETVFKNQSKPPAKEKKTFVNDTIRSDFHRKFMSKYIQ